MTQSGGTATLATRTVRGAVWSVATTVAVRLVSLLSLGLLARLLVPEQFGLMALGLVFLTYVETVGDLGTGAALIYWPKRRSEVSQVTFWVSLLAGLFWFGLTQAGAGTLAMFFRAPEVESVIRVLALAFPIRALGRTHDALCQKELRFKARLVPEAAMYVSKGVVAIGLAAAGMGVWSLVWGQLIGEVLRAVSLWIVVPWRPSLTCPVDLLGPVLRYGRGIIAVNLLAAVLHHADLVVVGRRLGTEDLGLYQIASKVPEITVALLVWGGAKVLFPALSQLQHSRVELRRFYLEALRWVAVLAVPATVGLFMLAAPLVTTCFGAAWRPAVPILRALAVYAGIRALGSHTGDVLKATGRSQLLAGLGVVKAAMLLPTLVWASAFGVSAVAGGLTTVSAVGLLINLWVVSRILDLRPRDLLDSLWTAVPGALATVVFLGRWVPISAGWSPLAIVIVGVGFGFSICLLGLFASAPERVRLAAQYLLQRDGSRVGAAAQGGVVKVKPS